MELGLEAGDANITLQRFEERKKRIIDGDVDAMRAEKQARYEHSVVDIINYWKKHPDTIQLKFEMPTDPKHRDLTLAFHDRIAIPLGDEGFVCKYLCIFSLKGSREPSSDMYEEPQENDKSGYKTHWRVSLPERVTPPPAIAATA